MTSYDTPIEPTVTMTPVREWLDDLRTRIESWSHDVRTATAADWADLRSSVANTLVLERVEGAVHSFLGRLGLRKGEATDAIADEWVEDLRRRVVEYRSGMTIECYEQWIVTPPKML